MGTFSSDRVSASEVAAKVEDAAAVGYRHFDCASDYGNEADIREQAGRGGEICRRAAEYLVHFAKRRLDRVEERPVEEREEVGSFGD